MSIGRKKTGKIVICQECGNPFYVINALLKKGYGKYCSMECKNKNIPSNFRRKKGDKDVIDRGAYLICTICGKTFRVRKYRKDTAKYCSSKCRIIGVAMIMAKENHPQWKGGISLENDLLRHTSEYKTWRESVYKRDFYTCQDCGKHCKSRQIVAHHLLSFAEFPLLRYDLNNGITLCRSCHLKRHRNGIN